MEFTYKAYKNLIEKLKIKNYEFCDYENYEKNKKSVILRHDIDTSLEKALEIAKLEKSLEVSAYYFILLSTDFYNINSKKSSEILKEIIKLGGKIGLHFDETKYEINTKEDYVKYINYELKILSYIFEEKINVVSMHRPSKEFLEMNLEIPNVINSYQKKFFKDFKYVSDSRMFWRENIEEIIEKDDYNKLHILTHSFWYSNNQNESMKEKLISYIKNGIDSRYDFLNENFRNLEEVILKKELVRDE